jgi:hypothetical protein
MFGTDICHTPYFDDSRKLCLYSYWDWKIADESNKLAPAVADTKLEISTKTGDK